jgi:hypothetical protein
VEKVIITSTSGWQVILYSTAWLTSWIIDSPTFILFFVNSSHEFLLSSVVRPNFLRHNFSADYTSPNQHSRDRAK